MFRRLLFSTVCCMSMATGLHAQGGQPRGFSVRGWSAVAPDYPVVTVRDVAAAPDGFYVAADIGPDDAEIGVVSPPVSDIYVARFDSSGTLAWSTTIEGSGRDNARAIAVDSQGYVYVAGATDSADFPTLRSLESPATDGGRAAFLWKIDPSDGAVVYSTVFGARSTTPGAAPVQSEALDVAVDADGIAYVTGRTNSALFPVTPDALDSTWPGPSSFGPARTAFVAKFAADGDLLHATYLGGENRPCGGGSNCIPVVPFTDGIRVALGPAGSFFVAGVTNTTDFPATAGALQTECRCGRMIGDVFITRFTADGRALEYATYLGGNPFGNPVFPFGQEGLADLAVDSAGAAYLAGWTGAPDFPTTPDAFQPDFHAEGDAANFEFAGVDGFAAKLSPTGDALEFSTFVGSFGEDRVLALARRPDGALVLSGATAADDFPLTPGFLDRGAGFLATLSPDGSALEFSTRLPRRVTDYPPPEGVAALSADSERLTLAGDSGLVTYLEPSAPDQPAIWALAGAAEFEPARHVSPSEVVSLYGVEIGPAEPASFELGSDGRVPFELAGVRAMLDGRPAPILYAQRDQINLVAPFGLPSEGDAVVQLLRDGAEISRVVTALRPTSPAVFPVEGAWAILNPDGTLNSSQSPAPAGSVVALWATGAGALSPTPLDGAVATPPFAAIEAPVRVLFSQGREAEVVYAGAAPNLVQGVVQINFRVPAPPDGRPQFGAFVLEIGGVRGPLAFVHAQ